jgi:hypothetical protein
MSRPIPISKSKKKKLFEETPTPIRSLRKPRHPYAGPPEVWLNMRQFQTYLLLKENLWIFQVLETKRVDGELPQVKHKDW